MYIMNRINIIIVIKVKQICVMIFVRDGCETLHVLSCMIHDYS